MCQLYLQWIIVNVIRTHGFLTIENQLIKLMATHKVIKNLMQVALKYVVLSFVPYNKWIKNLQLC